MSLSSLRMPITEPSQIQIAAGWFSMGSDTGQEVEAPVHRVWIDSFAMAATQVTVAEYARFLDATGNIPPPYWGDANFSHPQQPVVAVSWFDSVAYCAWLSAATGSHYRLPTEAEWERAARGGAEKKLFPWGDAPPMSRRDYHARWQSGPEQVAQSEPNAYGLFEMCENVHEWCSDWFAAGYYSISPDRNPQGPGSNRQKSLSRRLLAAPDQDLTMFGALQHSTGIQVRGLRFSGCSRRSCLTETWLLPGSPISLGN